MKLLATFFAHEARTQARSLRFRVLATAYVAAASAPGVLAYLHRADGARLVGGAAFAGEALAVLPPLTAVLALLISLDAITREQEQKAWSTVSLAGLSSAGYLLRRWLALQGILLPLTLLPVLAAGAAARLAEVGEISVLSFAIPWLLHIVPVAAATSALALGAGTIAGGAVNALGLFGFLVYLVPLLIDLLLARFGVIFEPPLAWIGLQRMGIAVYRMVAALRGGSGPWSGSFPLEMSDTPYDVKVAAEQLLARAAAPMALAAAALGLAVLYLRRTRPDVRPADVSPSHPLRTFLGALARLRGRYMPDPLPSRADLLALSLALLAAAGASVFLLERANRYEAMGRERFVAETWGGPPPTSTDLVPGRWRIEGRVGPGREVALQVAAEMRNVGRVPRAHLAFELNPNLRLESAVPVSGRLSAQSLWDRLHLELTPPLAPGESRELRFVLRGEPATTVFSLTAYFGSSFSSIFRGHLRRRFDRDLSDLSKSYQVPSISRRRVELEAPDLTPVPRYRAWTLDGEKKVPEETYRPPADLDLALRAPEDLFLADACGHLARQGRLAGRCRLPLRDLEVAGGRYRTLPASPGGLTVAVYPSHRAQGDLHLGFLARGSRKLDQAWPGLAGLRRMVIVEWPEAFVHALDPTLPLLNLRWDDVRLQSVRTSGELVFVREMDLTRVRPLNPDAVVARLIASRLSRRRVLAPADSPLFDHLFTTLALQRLGLGGESGATVTGFRPGQEAMAAVPPPGADDYNPVYWERRFPALLSALQARMGEEALRQALEDVLARQTERPLTRNELFAALKARSEAPLDHLIQDFFVLGLLPQPALQDVALHRSPGGWTVTGKMVNLGKGEALCRIVLTTDLGPVETTARAGTGESSAFVLTTTHRPQEVWLDPDRQCHRLAPNTFFGDRFYFEGRDG